MQKLKGFQKSLASGDGDPEIRAHSLKFERERREAESASVYDSFDPLKHGTKLYEQIRLNEHLLL